MRRAERLPDYLPTSGGACSTGTERLTAGSLCSCEVQEAMIIASDWPIRGRDAPVLRACLSVRFQGFTPSPQYRPSASSRLWPARPAAFCLPDPCGLGSDSQGSKAFSGKILEF